MRAEAMHAYLIDPVERTIKRVDVAGEDDDAMLASWYKLMECTDVEAVYPMNAEGDMLLLDEYGKYHPRGHFICRLWPREVLTGRALWIGRDGEEQAPPKCSLEYVQGHIAWR